MTRARTSDASRRTSITTRINRSLPAPEWRKPARGMHTLAAMQQDVLDDAAAGAADLRHLQDRSSLSKFSLGNLDSLCLALGFVQVSLPGQFGGAHVVKRDIAWPPS